MNTTDLLARTRMSAFIDDTNTDFTDSWILRELYDQLTQLYERAVVTSKQGYWKKKFFQLLTAGVSQYRIPRRCVAGGLHRVQIAYDSSQNWQDLDEVDEMQAQSYELGVGQTGQVQRWVMRGDTITLLPTPDGTNYALRIFYYVKPSRLIPPQLSATAGSVLTVVPSTRVVTLGNPLASIDANGVSTAITSGFWTFDCIEAAGGNANDLRASDDGGNWHELCLVEEQAAVTDSGLTLTFLNTAIDLSTIKVGDAVRARTQTDWPCIPDDYHRTLCDAAAVKILKLRSLDQKAAVLQESLSADVGRIADLLLPRVQSSAKAIVAPRLYRGLRRNWPVRYP